MTEIKICPRCGGSNWDTSGKICLNCGFNENYDFGLGSKKETSSPFNSQTFFRFKCNNCGATFCQLITSLTPYHRFPACLSYDVSVIF